MQNVQTDRTAGNAIDRLAVWMDWRLNPMLVKDVRCWLRSRNFLGTFFVALLVAQMITILAIVQSSDENRLLGHSYFVGLMGWLMLILCVVVPHGAKVRFRDELKSRSTELSLISRMTPRMVIHGKIQSSLAAGLLYFSAIGPSLLIMYLLGGFGLDAMANAIFSLLLLSVLCMVLSISFTAIKVNTKNRGVWVLQAVAGYYVFVTLIRLLSDIGQANMGFDWSFLKWHFICTFIGSVVIYLGGVRSFKRKRASFFNAVA